MEQCQPVQDCKQDTAEELFDQAEELLSIPTLENDRKALQLFQTAAASQYAPALERLGYMYEFGRGVKQDHIRSAMYYAEAAEKGNAYAQSSIGYYYHHGLGVEKNLTKAIYWYERSAEQCDVSAQHLLAGMYFNGTGVKQCYKKAAEYYELAAKQGFDAAQYMLGWLFENGLGVTRSGQDALKWYHMAAASGDATAMFRIGRLYTTGECMEKDLALAKKSLLAAAKLGHAHSQYELYNLSIEDGSAGDDEETNLWWLLRSAQQGFELAQHQLVYMLYNIKPAEAYYWHLRLKNNVEALEGMPQIPEEIVEFMEVSLSDEELDEIAAQAALSWGN